MSEWMIRVPGSSANLGAGFDVLGMAVSLYAEAGVGEPPRSARLVDQHHPAAVAFRRLGGVGPLWFRSPIPAGRGLGFSGAARVAGALAAIAGRDGVEAVETDDARAEALELTAELERHADNVAASIYGGIIVAADTTVTRVPLAFNPAIVAWVPDTATTSTDQSRGRLPDTVLRADAVFNLGRVAMFVAACAGGDVAALRVATDDRLHQPQRLALEPASAAAIETALAAGAWAAWLSGSGPTVALMCEPARAEEIAAHLPAGGRTKLLRIDHEGAVASATDVTDVTGAAAVG
jgi:homoserine kinase